jgi:hypothetical protein
VEMEAACSSEVLELMYDPVSCGTPEDRHLNMS